MAGAICCETSRMGCGLYALAVVWCYPLLQFVLRQASNVAPASAGDKVGWNDLEGFCTRGMDCEKNRG